ncbi:hypothetical protein [Halotia branconii]|uniref:Uncharacterized protein n=1 Tax=Halotia branconii CENA392 TaxID=1539056 RepID=A0AAJ6P9P8_9CYAN|nr:hypothetical protein [Halotia branconii]WGV25965.1 hypothetical protein QI031_00115 [Halotia branconii CENA392]
MEIILPRFNIDEAIDSHWKSTQNKANTIQRDRKSAEELALSTLINQFRNELSGCLDTTFQTSLNLRVVSPKEIAALAVYAIFSFMEVEIILKRDDQFWEITFGGRSVSCPADMLQKTILTELGKIRNEKRLAVNQNEI